MKRIVFLNGAMILDRNIRNLKHIIKQLERCSYYWDAYHNYFTPKLQEDILKNLDMSDATTLNIL
jgi:hypothetical protein